MRSSRVFWILAVTIATATAASARPAARASACLAPRRRRPHFRPLRWCAQTTARWRPRSRCRATSRRKRAWTSGPSLRARSTRCWCSSAPRSPKGRRWPRSIAARLTRRWMRPWRPSPSSARASMRRTPRSRTPGRKLNAPAACTRRARFPSSGWKPPKCSGARPRRSATWPPPTSSRPMPRSGARARCSATPRFGRPSRASSWRATWTRAVWSDPAAIRSWPWPTSARSSSKPASPNSKPAA